MTNHQLQLNINDIAKMIQTATKTFLNYDSVPHSKKLEGSDIKLANTIRSLGIYLSVLIPFSLSDSGSPPFVVHAI